MVRMSLKPRAVNFDEVWGGLLETVQQVVTMGSIKRTVWNERFSDVYSLCVAFPEPLVERLYMETKKLLESHVRELYARVSKQREENLLAEYHRYWLQFSKGTHYLNNLYSYLNSQHIQKQKFSDADLTYGSMQMDVSEQLLEIGELGLEIWQREMITPLQSRLVGVLLAGIQQDRQGATTDAPTSTIRGVIHSFVDVNMYKKKSTLQLYETVFEEELLRETGSFYRKEASSQLQECNVSQYMERVIARLAEEELRATKFLPPSSHKRVVKEVQDRMVADHLATVHAETGAMVCSERTRDLSNMYTLLRPVPNGLTQLVHHLKEHIKQQGLQAITNLKGDNIPAQFVESLLEVHKKYRTMISEVFHNDQQFVGALDKAFESVVNHRGNTKVVCRSPELLARYCDTLLKKSTKGLNESEVDDKLGHSITIFKYVDDKDVYQKFYARMLAKRLIQQQSQSMDSEENMINRLKQACGYEYTSKLHRMFTDMSVSSDLNHKFNDFLKGKNVELGINFSINVLQAGAWPLGQTSITPFAVPQELEKSVQTFERFYHKHFNGRKLTWLHHLCQGELKVSQSKRTYLITMSTFQMAMLLMFEKVDSLTCQELQTHTHLNDEQFTKFLQSLLDSKLLLTDAENLDEEAVVRLNTEYANKRTKFKISVAPQKEQQHETEQTHSAVEEDRKLYLQAAIVRIMKARRLLKHTMLIQEVISQSRARFAPQIPMIKKCIELLIDKQYLERTPNSTDEYSYVA
ncbi:cullin-2-like isoform X2 [Portunus trituberculatus]|uniref:cullin-2-like isoform X2 n=1 Tax=Portunus trituberculatus TaxID=210409 RepID=UPI001E1CBEE4|nr:cullin-2-like isoform X2 [Portunus trituberculatus]